MNGEEGIRKAYESILNSDFEQAIAWFEQAIALEPNNPAYHYKLSITYARSGRLAQAIRYAGNAIRLEPDNPTYILHLNHLKAKELVVQAEDAIKKNGNQLYLAVAMLKKAIKLDPLSLEAHIMLGMAYAGLKEYGHAVQALKDAVKLNPDQVEARRLLERYTHLWSEYLKNKQM